MKVYADERKSSPRFGIDDLTPRDAGPPAMSADVHDVFQPKTEKLTEDEILYLLARDFGHIGGLWSDSGEFIGSLEDAPDVGGSSTSFIYFVKNNKGDRILVVKGIFEDNDIELGRLEANNRNHLLGPV